MLLNLVAGASDLAVLPLLPALWAKLADIKLSIFSDFYQKIRLAVSCRLFLNNLCCGNHEALLMCTHNIDLCGEIRSTVDSRYLQSQGTLWNTSRVPRHQICRIEEKIIWTTTFDKYMTYICQMWLFKLFFPQLCVIGLLKLEIYWKYFGKEEKIAP